MKNTIKILSTGLMLLFMTPAAHAESALMKLPFGIEIGKPISDKSRDLVIKVNKKDIFKRGIYYYDFRHGWHADYYAASKLIKNTYLYGDGLKLPKGWRNTGLRLCDKHKKGSSHRDIKSILRQQGAVFIKKDKDGDLLFDVGEKYRFKFEFEDKSPCMTGILITRDVENEEF